MAFHPTSWKPPACQQEDLECFYTGSSCFISFISFFFFFCFLFCFCVTQNALQWPFFFFLYNIPSTVFGRTGRSFCEHFCSYLRHVWPVLGLFPWTHWQMFSSVFSVLAWVTSTCLICMWNFLGTISRFINSKQVWLKHQFTGWSLLLLQVIAVYSSYN